MQSRNASGLLIGAALLAGCGGSVTRGPDGKGEPPDPIYSTLPEMTFTVAPGGSARLDFEVDAGDLSVSIDWQDPANTLVAVLTSRACHSVNDALSGRCRDTEVSSSASTCPAKPRILNYFLHSPRAMRLWVANTGATAEAGRAALTHCRAHPDCGATGSCLRCWSESPRSSCAP